MKSLKKLVATTAMAATLFVAAPAPKANAGIILAPAGIGIVLIILGVIHDSLGLVILDGEQATTDQVKSKLAQKYDFIDDEQALTDLADLILEKASAANNGQDTVEIKLTREEILNILEPTGLALVEAQKVESLISDLN